MGPLRSSATRRNARTRAGSTARRSSAGLFERILIANRGEIACRIIGTCRRLGVASVAVYSDADAGALHVRLADEARRLGPAAARDSYLDIERVIEAARASGAQAVHPGYGFLAENPRLAERVAAAGLVFIGPPVAAMRSMSSKAAARELMLRAGVPVLPGYQGERQDGASLAVEAGRIGYPVLIKPVAGGGGKGMRMVADPADFASALATCRREALGAFGDADVLLEKFLPAPRHVEVQVFGDEAGTVVHLYERDCSAQRRHQKVLEEAPAPHLSAAQRAALSAAACEAARAVGYRSAGTVEFLLDEAGRHYFIEMNTRIQVEHAVTEMITGVDLVEWQLRVAAGEPLPLAQEAIRSAGHAIEARLYAEQPEAGFLPASGRLRRFELPPAGRALRLETGVRAGDSVGIDYDPMLAKLIVHAGTRAQAVAALQDALAQVRIVGVGNNLAFLRRLAASAELREGRIDTGFIERELPRLITTRTGASHALPDTVLAAAALWTLAQERAAAAGGCAGAGARGDGADGGGSADGADGTDSYAAAAPWRRADGWRLNATGSRTLRFEPLDATPDRSAGAGADAGGAAAPAVVVEYRAPETWLAIGERRGAACLLPAGTDVFAVRFIDTTVQVSLIEDAGELSIGLGLDQYRVRRYDPLQVAGAARGAAGGLVAPMPGRILAQLVDPGETVAQGTPLLIME
ncbi:MAG TPA: biotin carboxylase N-terminal domain-containing protein, partial [Steroidobacteraceae bacterium]|nr:biotin carboxylase N-terminal domain-containing protein [Steroidobacteraceae bacterium]